jgi:hypothetical protein
MATVLVQAAVGGIADAAGAAARITGKIGSGLFSLLSTVFRTTGGGVAAFSRTTLQGAKFTTQITRGASVVVSGPGGIFRTTANQLKKRITDPRAVRNARRNSQQGAPLQSAVTSAYTNGIAPAIGVIVAGFYFAVPSVAWVFQKLIRNFGSFTDKITEDATNAQTYLINEKRDSKNPVIKGLWIGLEIIIWCLALIISFFFMIVTAVFAVIANFFLNYFITSLVLVLAILFFDLLQHNYRDLVGTVNNVTVGSELFLKKMSTVLNAGLDIQNVFAPLTNVAWDSTWRTFAVLFGTVADSDYSPSFTNFWQGDKTPTSPNPDTQTFNEGAGSGRRLSDEAFRDRVTQVEEPMVEIAWLMQLYNAFMLFVFRFQLMLVYPFFETILQVLSFVVGKVQCAISGGMYCTVVELTQAGVNFFILMINGFLSFFGGGGLSLVTTIACTAGELRHVSAKECGGFIADPYPFGAFFSNLRPTDSSQRRALSDQFGPLLECYEHPLDHSWVEVFEKRVIHQSHTEKCPISMMAMTGTTKQQILVFERLKLHTDCYQLCTLGVHSLQCHFWNTQNVTLTLLGSCNYKVAIESHGHARRQLVDFFPGRFMSWLDVVPQQLRSNVHTVIPTQSTSHNSGSFSSFSTIPNVLFTSGLQTKQSLVSHLQRKMGTVFTTNGIRCDLSDSSTAFGQFVNHACIVLKLSEEHGPSLVDRIAQQAREFSSHTADTVNARDRKLGEETVNEPEEKEANGVGRGLDERQKRLLEGATRGITKHLQKMKRAFRLYVAHKPQRTKDGTSRLFRTIEMIEPNRIKWTKEQMQRRRLGASERRRLDAEEMQGSDGSPLGFCKGDGMYPCPSGACVAFEDRDLCPPVDETVENPGLVKQLNQVLHDLSLYDVDPERFLDSTFECYNGYRENPDLVPVTHTNLETKGQYADFCTGYQPYIDYRFPKPEVKGINRFIDTACNLDDGVNHCVCSWYYETALAYSAFSFSFITVDIEYHMRNAFLVTHTILYVVVFQWEFLDPWRDFWENLWPSNSPDWFRYFFSHLGVYQVTFFQRVKCAGLNLGSLLHVFFIPLVVLIFWPAATLFHNWFLAMTVNKQYMKLRDINVSGLDAKAGDKKQS